MTPHCVVQAKDGRRQLDAGVVQSVEKDRAGEVQSVTVKWDTDGAIETLYPEDLTVLAAH